MHPVKNLVILYTLYDHLVTKRFTLSAFRNLHLHRQLRLGERIRFRHRGTFQQVSIGMTISRSPPTTSHITVSITTMIYYSTTTPRYTSLDRRRDERNSPPKSPPPFSKAESRFEREQRIKVEIQGFSNF